MNDIFHNPSFKKDFVFIHQLDTCNKDYQDKIWEKFFGSSNKHEDDIRIVNTRFESHPSVLSSESENSVPVIEEDFETEASFKLSSVSLELKSQKQKSKSISRNRMVINEAERNKLHKQLTQHLKDGTLNEFNIKNIGEFTSTTSSKNFEDDLKEDLVPEEKGELYLDQWGKSQSSSPLSMSRSLSEISLKEKNVQVKEISSAPVQGKKVSEEIEGLKGQLEQSQKLGNKIHSSGLKMKLPEDKERKKFKDDISLPSEWGKSKYYIEKCIGVIRDISILMNHANIPPDGSDDYARRQVRTKEFTSRFSRVYLYPLFTHMSKLISGEKLSDIYAKFTSMYQLTYQALQSCFNHLPNTVGTSSYKKLRECLNCAIDICDQSRKSVMKEVNYSNEDYVRIFKSHCIELIHKIEDDFLSVSVNSLLNSKSTRTSLLPSTQNNRKMVRSSENKMIPRKRFSMYDTNLSGKRNKHWKKIMAAFDDNKPKVKSRYRTATFKHRPPVEKINSQTMLQQRPHRLDDKRSLVVLRNTPVVSPINEDHIQTLIQYENERTNGDENEKEVIGEKEEAKPNRTFFIEQDSQSQGSQTKIIHTQEDILTKLLQLVQDNDLDYRADTDANLTNTIMVLQKCLSLKNQRTELLRTVEGGEDVQLNVQNSLMKLNTDCRDQTQKKESSMTISGTKNAQLICITDDNSIMSITSKRGDPTFQRKPPDFTEQNFKSKEVQTSTFQLFEGEEPKLNRSKSNIKISRVNRPRRLLQLLPKSYAIDIIHCKLMFYKHNKGNYMYKKTLAVKPWELMEKISERILDHTLMEISKEIEVSDLLENIYNAEFQY